MRRRRGSSRKKDRNQVDVRSKFRVNNKIRVPQVMLIDEERKPLGTLQTHVALERAQEAGLDLVEVSPNTSPPVCRIFDFGKFIYQREKKLKEAKKHQKVTQLKEIKFRPYTDVHDYNFKVKHVIEFLGQGNKVKVTVRFKGQEMDNKDKGRTQIEKVIEATKTIAKLDSPVKMEGRIMHIVLGPLSSPTHKPSTPKKTTEKNTIKQEVPAKNPSIQDLIKQVPPVANKA